MSDSDVIPLLRTKYFKIHLCKTWWLGYQCWNEFCYMHSVLICVIPFIGIQASVGTKWIGDLRYLYRRWRWPHVYK